jgi:hypothetical protein
VRHKPPDAASISPVTHRASSDARKTATGAPRAICSDALGHGRNYGGIRPALRGYQGERYAVRSSIEWSVLVQATCDGVGVHFHGNHHQGAPWF